MRCDSDLSERTCCQWMNDNTSRSIGTICLICPNDVECRIDPRTVDELWCGCVPDKSASKRLPFFIICRFCCPLAVLPFCVTSTFSVEFPFRFMFCLVCCPCVPVLRPGRKRTRCAMFRRRAAPPRYEVVDLRPPPGRGRVCPLPGLIELIEIQHQPTDDCERSCKCT